MKKRVAFSLTPVLIGVLLLGFVMTRPRFATYRWTDICMLVLAGFLFGIGLGGYLE
jgi:hypothetical protein